jgi:hypothetical protein
MARTSLSGDSIVLDTTQLKSLARDLKKVGPEVTKDLRVKMRALGLVVAKEAKERAGFSTRIPKSIVVRTSGFNVKVAAGGPKAPGAAPLENKGKSGSFRHPVFGNGRRGTSSTPWVDQPARPFLGPAMDAKAEEVEKGVLDAVDDALRDIGFH